MTRLWPEGEVIGTPVGMPIGAHVRAQHAAPLQETFVWRGMVHRITHVCNRWRIDTHWWARLHEVLLGAEPGTPPSVEGLGEGETCSAGTDPPSPTDRERSALSPKGERRSIWREYVKVTTDTGLLCLLYRDLHDGGWFLARVYD
jgi:hypothetical protein